MIYLEIVLVSIVIVVYILQTRDYSVEWEIMLFDLYIVLLLGVGLN